jgi:AcrR family transcriptional regulator
MASSSPLETPDARKARSRSAMRQAMLELLGEKQFDEIQITDLTARAGVGYATFFRHYETTRDVLGEVAGEEISALLEMSIPVLKQTDSATSTNALCRFVHDRRVLWHTLLTGGAAHSVRAEFVRQAREWSRRFGGGETSVPMDLGTVCSAGSTIDALAWWLDQGEAYSVDDMARFINQLIITPFIGGK